MTSLLVPLLLLATTAAATPPLVIEQAEADYPAWARGSGLATRVPLRVRVAADGHPTTIEVVPYTTRHDVLTRQLRASFDSAAVRAVRRWRFRPATRGGRPVAGWLQVEVPFDEAWTRGGDPITVMPDSIRWPRLWNALIGEWSRMPTGSTPEVLRFLGEGRFAERDGAGRQQEGRFQISADVDDPGAQLVRVADVGGGRRVNRVRFAGRDTLLLCPWPAAGACDTFVATGRGARP